MVRFTAGLMIVCILAGTCAAVVPGTAGADELAGQSVRAPRRASLLPKIIDEDVHFSATLSAFSLGAFDVVFDRALHVRFVMIARSLSYTSPELIPYQLCSRLFDA